MRRWYPLLWIPILAAVLAPAHAEPAEVGLPQTETRFLKASTNSQEYRILVGLPQDYPKPNHKYPVVYLLDADILFGMVTETARLLPMESFFLGQQIVPPAIIVGIAYPGGPKEMALKRDRDLSWRERASEDGALPFFEFLRDDLIPLVEKTYPADPGDRTLVGTSTAGSFALGAMLQFPAVFQRYVVASPRLDPVIFGLEEQAARKRPDLHARLYLSAGKAGRIEGMIFEGLERFHQALEARNYRSLVLTRETFEHESHVSAQPTAFVRGLKAVFREAPGTGATSPTD